MEEIELRNLNDSHFHIKEMIDKDINFDDFISRWINLGGKTLIDIGIEETDYDERRLFSKDYNFIYHTVGIHPNNAGGDIENRFKILEHHLEKDINNKIVGIGETGLDYYWDSVPKEIQKTFFIRQIDLAIKYNKPVIIHNRDATEDVLKLLTPYKGKITGIIHCYSSTKENISKFLNLGFFISFAGNVTYKKNIEIQESLKIVELDKLLIETDSPYLSPVPKRGRLNNPINIKYTYQFVEETLKVENLKNILDTNLKQIFRL